MNLSHIPAHPVAYKLCKVEEDPTHFFEKVTEEPQFHFTTHWTFDPNKAKVFDILAYAEMIKPNFGAVPVAFSRRYGELLWDEVNIGWVISKTSTINLAGETKIKYFASIEDKCPVYCSDIEDAELLGAQGIRSVGSLLYKLKLFNGDHTGFEVIPVVDTGNGHLMDAYDFIDERFGVCGDAH